jgi:hypothetical protein
VQRHSATCHGRQRGAARRCGTHLVKRHRVGQRVTPRQRATCGSGAPLGGAAPFSSAARRRATYYCPGDTPRSAAERRPQVQRHSATRHRVWRRITVRHAPRAAAERRRAVGHPFGTTASRLTTRHRPATRHGRQRSAARWCGTHLVKRHRVWQRARPRQRATPRQRGTRGSGSPSGGAASIRQRGTATGDAVPPRQHATVGSAPVVRQHGTPGGEALLGNVHRRNESPAGYESPISRVGSSPGQQSGSAFLLPNPWAPRHVSRETAAQ